MSTNLDKYDIIDTFDDNQFQTVLMGIDTLTMVDIVIINKLKSSIQLDDDFFSLYQDICDNLISLERNEDETIIINQYKQSQLLNDYLHEEDLSFESRVLLAKSFLLQAVNYQDFSNAIKIVLVNEDQLTVRNNQLHFSNYLFLKKYHNHVTNSDVLKSMGQTLETILQLYKEPLTAETKPYQSLIYKLMNSDLDYDIRQLYQKFDAVSKGHQEDEPVKETLKVQEIVSLSKDDIKLVEDPEEKKVSEEVVEEVIILNDDLEKPQEISDQLIEDIKQENKADKQVKAGLLKADIIEKTPAQEEPVLEISEETLQVEVKKETLAQEEPVLESSEETLQDEVKKETPAQEEPVLENSEEILQAEVKIETPAQEEPVLEKSEEILQAEVKKETPAQEEPVLEKSEEILQAEVELLNETQAEEEILEPKINESLDEILLDDKIHLDSQDKGLEETLTKPSKESSKDNKHHRIVLENKTKGDSIQEILDRNDRLHNTFNEESKKKRYFPTFLLFFIVLTIITVLLILYSSTYA